MDRSNHVSSIPLKLQDVMLKVQYNTGDIFERWCACNSKDIVSSMRCVGVAIMAKYWWVVFKEILNLIIDNSSGNVIDVCISEYIEILLIESNIVIIHQVPISLFFFGLGNLVCSSRCSQT